MCASNLVRISNRRATSQFLKLRFLVTEIRLARGIAMWKQQRAFTLPPGNAVADLCVANLCNLTLPEGIGVYTSFTSPPGRSDAVAAGWGEGWDSFGSWSLIIPLRFSVRLRNENGMPAWDEIAIKTDSTSRRTSSFENRTTVQPWLVMNCWRCRSLSWI